MNKLKYIFPLLLLGLPFQSGISQFMVKENFMGSGNLLGQTNSYTGTSWIKGADGTKPFSITAGSLSYPGYIASDTGNKVGFSSSGSDVAALPFQTSISEGNIYVSCLIRISYVNPNTSGGYFLGLCLKSGSNYKSTFFAKKDGNNKVAFGIGIKTSANKWTDFVYDLNTTYLVVIKFQIKSGDSNDITSFIVNPALTEIEPDESLWINNTSTSSDIPIEALFLRNGNSSSCPGGYVGNIRVATTWKDIIVDPAPSITTSSQYLTGFKTIATGGPSSEDSFKVSGSNLLENLQITPPAHYEISTTSGSDFVSSPLSLSPICGGVPPTSVFVRLKAGLPVGSYTGESILISSGTASKSVICNGSINKVISTSVSFLNGLSYNVGEGPSSEKTVEVKGINLTDNLTLTLSPSDYFEMSTVSGANFNSSTLQILPDHGTVDSPLYIRLKAGLPVGSYSAKLIVSSGDIVPQKIFINGSSYDPNIPKNTTVSVTMGKYNFSWTFDQPVASGYFVDGQPWIIVPSEGVNMLSASPARINGANVYKINYSTNLQEVVVADINQTVVNPPIGTYYIPNQVKVKEDPVFGWDSRGAIRHETPTSTSYNPSLGWDGITPKLLKAGDVVTTAQSITTPSVGETVLDAVAVLTVLSSPPPADAFRPGVVRSAERRLNPEFFTLSRIIDLTPYLIQKPTKNALGTAVSSTVPSKYSASYLTGLMPGPSIMNTGLNFSRSFKATYNDSGETYGSGVAQNLGDVAVGALASWFTPEERKQCQIHLLQRAIDTYEVITAGCDLSHNGGYLPGYGALLTIAGKIFDYDGMLSFNQSVNGLDPAFYMSDYAQMIYIEKEGVIEPNTPQPGALRRVPLTDIDNQLMNRVLPFTSAENGKLVVDPNFVWPNYRAARHVINLKLKIESGAGAGKEYYIVTGIKDYYDAATNALTNVPATEKIKGGTLTIKPYWMNGLPDATSVIKTYDIVPSELPTWSYKGSGVSSMGVYSKFASMSPDADYIDVNVGSYVAYLCAMFAIDAEKYYTAGWDQWLLNIMKKPGFGPSVLQRANSRYIYANRDDETRFLSGLWRQCVMEKAGDMSQYSFETSYSSLIPPASDDEVLNAMEENYISISNNDNIKLYFNQNHHSLNFESKEEVNRMEIFSLTGQKLLSVSVNSKQGTIDLNGIRSKIVIVRAILKNNTESKKLILNK